MPSEKSQINHDKKVRPGIREPERYEVVLHNDDFTTMEFVVDVLRKVFFKPEEEANQLMLKVHKEGKATVGLYTLDIAVSKSQKAMRMARDKGFPFKLTWEPEERDIPF